MKKHIVKYLSILVAMITLLSCIPASASKEKWYPSDDGEFEAQIVSIEPSNAQDYDITIRIRLIEENKSVDVKWTIPYSIVEDEIKQFVSENPSYKNKRMTITAEKIEKVTYNDGTYYSIIIPLMIGRKDAFVNGLTVKLVLNLAEQFPDDYFDRNIAYALDAFKMFVAAASASNSTTYDFAAIMYNAYNFSISDAYDVYVKEYEGIVYSAFQVNYKADVSYAGLTQTYDNDQLVIVAYDPGTEKYAIYEFYWSNRSKMNVGDWTASNKRQDEGMPSLGVIKGKTQDLLTNGAQISAQKVMAQYNE